MNYRGRCWFLVAVPLSFLGCGDTSDDNPSAAAGQGGASAGASGATSARGGGESGGGNGSIAGGQSGDNDDAFAGGADAAAAGDGNEIGASGASGDTHASDVLMPVVKAFCAAARACCAAENMETDLDGCETSFAAHDPTFAALERGTATVDASGLSGCLAAYQEAASKCQEVPVLRACQGLIHGTRKEQEKCVNVGECAHEKGEAVACVIGEQNATEGVCMKVTHGKLGDSCLSTCNLGDDCSFTSFGVSDSSVTYCFEQEGLFCSFEDGHCAALAPLGAACTPDNCGSANYCDTTCKKRGGLGESCSPACLSAFQCIDNQCQSPSFTVGSTCSGQWFGPY